MNTTKNDSSYWMDLVSTVCAFLLFGLISGLIISGVGIVCGYHIHPLFVGTIILVSKIILQTSIVGAFNVTSVSASGEVIDESISQ